MRFKKNSWNLKKNNLKKNYVIKLFFVSKKI